MPQKGYLANKKSLPKLIDSDALQCEPENVDSPPVVSKTILKESISLYVRGPAWIKDRDNAVNRLKDICPKITDVRHPRQKSADYCFIDFASATERDESFEKLKDNDELQVKTLTKDVPKLLQKRKKKIMEKREAKKETRQLLAKIKKNQREQPKEKTNQLIVANLPIQATSAELKEHFSDAININLKLKKKTKKLNSAIITFPDPDTATKASKASIVLHGQKLNVFLNTDATFKAQAKTTSKTKRKKPEKMQILGGSKKKITKV